MRLNNLTKRIDALEQIEDNWPNIRTAIVQALDVYPKAKEALIAQLQARRNNDRDYDLAATVFDAIHEFPEAREAVILALMQNGVMDCPCCAFVESLTDVELDRAETIAGR